ncbi:DUF7146 domain-containing protein [Shinella oryzae]|uniref:Toprim domain-containing protein n=1 Tax=Shinella oryzae TaxID=2871820 RepID=A0ABY9K3D9_9HYPH|nr:toprim domain-containing protein [Shinella oryzae]WLS03103.1 toprim domain-containing protein [Shinella oryzae]
MTIDIKTAARLLGGDASRNRVSCPGPGHSKRDRSLSVTFHADGTFSTTSFAGDDFRDCRDHVKAKLGMSDERRLAVTAPAVAVSSGGSAARVGAISRLWSQCIPIKGTLAERYLERRGLSYDGDGWRFRPTSRALIAIITDAVTGDPIGWHETLLDADGNKTGRLMHGRATGGVVRLYDEPGSTEISIAEGIETALATGARPIWACLSSSIMKGLPVLPSIEQLTVFADHDHAGVKAANEVGERWHAAGRRVTLTMPGLPGLDFDDAKEAA